MTDSSLSPSVRMPPNYGNLPRGGGGVPTTGDPSEASRLLDGCHQIMVAMSSPSIFENSKEKAFQTFRRGCLDLKKDVSATEGLESDKIDDWMIENCWLFLFELAKARLRRKHVLECMEILCTSDKWRHMLDDNERIRAKMVDLDEAFIQSIVTEFHVKPFPAKAAPVKPKPTSSLLNRRNRSNNRQTNHSKWETGSVSGKVTTTSSATSAPPPLQRGRSASLGALDISEPSGGDSRDDSVKRSPIPSNIHDDAESSHGSWSIEEVEEGDLNNNNNNQAAAAASPPSPPLPPQSPDLHGRPRLQSRTSVIIIDKTRRGSAGSSSKGHSTVRGGGDDSPGVAHLDSPKLDTNPFRNPKLFEDANDGITDDDTVSVDEWWNNPGTSRHPSSPHEQHKSNGLREPESSTTEPHASPQEVEMLYKQQEMILNQQEQLFKAIQLLTLDQGSTTPQGYTQH